MMGRLIAGYGVSHTAMMIRKNRLDNHVHQSVHRAFAQVREDVEKLSPDLLVVVGSEHLKSFGYEAFPQICIGIGDTCEGWADGGLAAARLDLAGDYAGQLLSAGIDAGFDLAFSVNPRLDHGFMAPLVLIRPEMDIPVVPIFQNASTEPLPPLRRSAELGRLIRAVTEQRPDEERVVIIGTGGLSHWVGTPQMGQVNSEFDELFLARVRDGDLEGVVDMTMSDVVAQGGNGAPEIRNWVTVMSARRGKGTVLAYEAVREWATGIALARLFPEGVDEPAT